MNNMASSSNIQRVISHYELQRLEYIAAQDKYHCSLECWELSKSTKVSKELPPSEMFYEVHEDGTYSIDIDECAGSCINCIPEEDWKHGMYATAADIKAYVNSKNVF